MFNFGNSAWANGFGVGMMVAGLVISTIAGIVYLADGQQREAEYERWRKQLWGERT